MSSTTRMLGNLGATLAVLACVACTGYSFSLERGVSASDEELLATLASLARRGAGAVCDVNLMSQELQLEINLPPANNFIANEVTTVRQQRTEEIRPLKKTVGIKSASYRRHETSRSRSCTLNVIFYETRLCNTDSQDVQKIMGTPVTYGPPSPHRTIFGYSYSYKPSTGVDSTVDVGNSLDICANGFSLTAIEDIK